MSHIGYPIIISDSEDETLLCASNYHFDLSEDDTVIEVRGPANLDQFEQPAQPQVKEAKLSRVRMPFTRPAEEDEHFLWRNIESVLQPEAAPSIKRELHTSAYIRSNYSCRERGKNDKKPTPTSNRYSEKRWSKQEDHLLLELVIFLRSCWKSIARHMPGRTEHTLKKRYQKLMKYPRHFASHGVIVVSDSSPAREEELQYQHFIS